MSAQQQALLWVTPVAWDFNLNAVDFDGSTEYLANNTMQTIWIANSFTVAWWFKSSSISSFMYLFNTDNNSNPNVNAIALWMNASKIYAFIKNPDANQKQYQWATTLSNNTRYYIALTWNWSIFNLYLNWVADTPYSKITDWTPTTMTDSNRWCYIACWRTLSPNWPHVVSHVAVWNTALSATELLALYDSGNGYKLDVRNSKWNYTSTSALKHQWVPWKDWTSITTMWTDYVASGWINIWSNAANISSADIVTF